MVEADMQDSDKATASKNCLDKSQISTFVMSKNIDEAQILKCIVYFVYILCKNACQYLLMWLLI